MSDMQHQTCDCLLCMKKGYGLTSKDLDCKCTGLDQFFCDCRIVEKSKGDNEK
jgi:hypothetical protein